MNLLTKKLSENEKFKQYVSDIKNKISPISISGLSDVGKSHVIAGTINGIKKPICMITYNEMQAKKLIKDLQFFLGEEKEIVYFPKKEISPYDYVSQSKDLPYERIHALNKIYHKDTSIIVTTIEAIMQKMPEKDLIYQNIISFKVGEIYTTPNNKEYNKKNLEELKQILVALGYERNDLVESEGQFSIRGGIVDIGLSEKNGVRIEFWGDEVDSIRYFNLSSQRSNEMVNEITIYPAHEYIVSNNINLQDEQIENTEVGKFPMYSKNIETICGKIEKKYIQDENLTEELKKNVKSDIEQIKNGDYISKIDKYFNAFYEKTVTLLDYLSNNYLLCFDEMNKIGQRRENIIIENNNLIKSLIEKERFVPEAIQNISEGEFTQKNWIKEFETDHQIIYLQTNNSYTNINKYEFDYREINVYKSEIDLLLSDMTKWLKDKKEVILLAGNEANVEKISNLLKEKEIDFELLSEETKNNKSSKPAPKLAKLAQLSLSPISQMPSAGFESYDLKLVVISLQEAFETELKKKKASKTFKEGEKIVFADLKPGDFVVHRSHGIGQFVGVNTITADNVTKDYIKIKYKNDDMLYVPTSNLDNVRKYIGGGDNISPKLNKLGSKEWNNTKERVKKNLQEVAKDLIELYAKRQKIKGFAFSQDTAWQNQFEDNFPYQETDDQLRCIEEVKKDMEMPRPMDRLLCGDVGYGKTEVAIRAAFKAVMDQKQVAYLVPTTVLSTLR